MWYLKDNKNRPYANELIAAVESPCANGGVLTFVLDCIRSASPGSTEIFGRRLARHLLSFDFRCNPMVVRGFLAKMGVDFYATFSPMSSLITARTLMALAVHHNLPVAHADIPQAFVQSVLKRPIYCKFPQGVEICPKLLASAHVHTFI